MGDGDNLVVLGIIFIKTVGPSYRCRKGFQGKVCWARSWDTAEVKKSCIKGTQISHILITSSTFFTQVDQKTLN